MDVELRIEGVLEATVSPSEDQERVAGAVDFLAGKTGRVEVRKSSVSVKLGKIEELTFLRDQLRDRRIRSAARRLLLKSIDRGEATLLLNRQAAATGVVALCSAPEESPLGPIILRVRSRKLEQMIDWLAEFQDS